MHSQSILLSHSSVMYVCSAQLGFQALSWKWAYSFTPSVMDDRSHLFYNLPFSYQFLHRQQIIPLAVRGTCVQSTGSEM